MWKFLISLLPFVIFIQLSSSEILHRTRMLKCSASNKTVKAETLKCFAKSFSRDFTTINVNVDILRPVYNGMVFHSAQKKNL